MEKNLFDDKPFKESYLPSGVEESADQEVICYNKILEDHQWIFKSWESDAMGISGLMSQGHPLLDQTHLVQLDDSTIRGA